MGGRSSEREISLKTGRAMHGALVRRGYDAVAIDVDGSLLRQLRTKRIDVALVALHGPGGEDGTIQGFLETIGLPYSGSGVRASAVAMHKGLTRSVLAQHGLPVAPGTTVRAGERRSWKSVRSDRLRFPVVVKPATQGSTIGISIARTERDWLPALRQAHAYDEEAIVEAFIPGRELTVSILADGKTMTALPPVEIVAPQGFYDFSAKYQKGRTRYLCPAPLPAPVRMAVKDIATRAFRAVGCEGAARVDFRVTPAGKPYVLELNTIPGMTETSLLPMAAAAAGIDYDRLTERLLESALARQRRWVQAQGGRGAGRKAARA